VTRCSSRRARYGRLAHGAESYGIGLCRCRRPRRIALSGLESLTPSERCIAHMAAKGLTNREIGQALFVTPKTVEIHLSSTYRKLGIKSRSQLPGGTRRLGSRLETSFPWSGLPLPELGVGYRKP
jgi:DNA-binding NarL/FixJ family response regulator